MLRRVIPCLLLALPFPLVADEPTAEQVEFFEKKVRPVLAESCFKCHGPKKQEGSLRLDSRAGVMKGGDTGPAVVPGDPAKSELIDAIGYEPTGYQMPPTGKLPKEAIDALTAWVEMGAPWPGDAGDATVTGDGFDLAERAKHWSFRPIARPDVPDAGSGWARNAIDRFVAERRGDLPAAEEADKRTLLRRVTFDLIGLPPTPEEIEAFLADESPDAYERAVDRLLASPRYGERWARHWMDLVRFAETAGHEFDYTIHHAWPYRDYLVRAFNEDLPYDRLVVEHVAGDLVETPRLRADDGANESVIGTAFWQFGQGKHSPVDIRAEECDRVDNQIDVFGKAFLGLTIACARCHDHKFDAISTRDYYALAGVMESSRTHYAIVNPPAETVVPARAIQRAQRTFRPHLAGYVRDRLGTLLAGLSDPGSNPSPAFAKLLEAAGKDADHPLHGLAQLTATNDPAEREKRRRALADRLQREHEAWWNATNGPNPRKDVSLIADFDDGDFGDWYVTGQAWGDRPTVAGDVIVGDDVRQPVRELPAAGMAHSGVLDPKLEGELRSPTFTVTKPVVWYRVARHGGKGSPGRQNKNGQVHLIVDGFQFVKNPLYGQLTINVQNDGVMRWVRQDASKFVGKKAYVELLDEDDGWLVVDRIVMTDGAGPPPEPPNAMLQSILGSELVAKQPARRFGRSLASSLDLWVEGRLTNHPKHAGAAALVNAFLDPALADDRPLDEPTVALGAMEARRTVAEARKAIRPAVRAIATVDGSGENVPVLVRGNHTKEGTIVERRFLEVFAGTEPHEGSGRLDIAERLVSPDNPLVARVLVNRLWQHHFGRGIVASPDNLGILGAKPSHPELLDWLASEFVRRRWSIKAMHRLMVTSATYRQSSAITDPSLEARDPGNVLLHRARVRRLEGEAIRDAILAVSGRLDQRMYGPSVMPHLTPFMEGRGRPGQSGPLDGDGRRSLYVNVRRNFLMPFFLAFDFPTPFTTTGRRSTSNVPAQSLTLMNNPFVVQQAEVWSRRLDANEPDAETRVERAYRDVFGRPPTGDEVAAAVAFVESQGKEYGSPGHPKAWADLCHVLFNVKEFVFVQ